MSGWNDDITWELLAGLELELVRETMLLALLGAEHLSALFAVSLVCHFYLLDAFHIEDHFESFDSAVFALGWEFWTAIFATTLCFL